MTGSAGCVPTLDRLRLVDVRVSAEMLECGQIAVVIEYGAEVVELRLSAGSWPRALTELWALVVAFARLVVHLAGSDVV